MFDLLLLACLVLVAAFSCGLGYQWSQTRVRRLLRDRGESIPHALAHLIDGFGGGSR